MAKLDPAIVAQNNDFAGQDVPWLLKQRAETTPDKAFMVWEPKSGEDKSWSYKAFDEEIRKIAAGLITRGVKKGDMVLIHAENCPEMVLAWYACAVLGAVGVTTNTRSVGGEIEYFASHTNAVAAITQPQFVEQIKANAKTCAWIVVTDDNSGEAADGASLDHGCDSFSSLYGDPATVPEREPEPMLPAGIMFTSGTTSLPKAVVHTHANVLWSGKMGASSMDFRKDDKYLAFLPFFHVNAQSWAFWGALGAGATAVLQPKFSASRFWQVIEKHQITHCSMIPFVFKAIGAQPVPENHSLRMVPMGIVWPDIGNWLKTNIFASWGMTETVTHATRNCINQVYPQNSIGKPTPGYTLAVVDPDSGEPVAPGEIGELYLHATRGVTIFLEYYNNEEANKKAFTEDGWFKTGDMVRVGEEGNFFFCDRDKDALKVGGENVSARQVEEVCMANPLGGIGDCAVVAQKHDMLDMVPVLFITESAFGAPEDKEAWKQGILEHCAANLADFKVPRAIYILDELPKATLDKIAKNKLREIADAYADEAAAQPA